MSVTSTQKASGNEVSSLCRSVPIQYTTITERFFFGNDHYLQRGACAPTCRTASLFAVISQAPAGSWQLDSALNQVPISPLITYISYITSISYPNLPFCLHFHLSRNLGGCAKKITIDATVSDHFYFNFQFDFGIFLF